VARSTTASAIAARAKKPRHLTRPGVRRTSTRSARADQRTAEHADGARVAPDLAMHEDAPFVTDVETIRKRARDHLETGAVTLNYQGELDAAIRLLNDAIATEIVCVLRYRYHAAVAAGISSDSVKAEFEEHARDEDQHMRWLAERVNQLGGKPNLSPEGLATRSATQYVEGADLVGMIRENLVAERIVIEIYRDLIRYFADKDPTTRILFERILAQEEDHANDMHDLLVAHEGTPMLDH
jgi:bacterioferritin